VRSPEGWTDGVCYVCRSVVRVHRVLYDGGTWLCADCSISLSATDASTSPATPAVDRTPLTAEFRMGSDFQGIPHIQACVDAGIVQCFPDGSYRPSLPVNRAAMAVFVARALAGGDSGVPDGPTVPTFQDVPVGHWAYKYIEYCHEHGVVGGYGDATYRPELMVNRGLMAVFVARAMAGGDANVPDDPNGPAFFPDVQSGHWASKFVEYCHDRGFVNGYWDGTYRPEIMVDRGVMAVYVQRAFQLPM